MYLQSKGGAKTLKIEEVLKALSPAPFLYGTDKVAGTLVLSLPPHSKREKMVKSEAAAAAAVCIKKLAFLSLDQYIM
jgi:hypothetical protein